MALFQSCFGASEKTKSPTLSIVTAESSLLESTEKDQPVASIEKDQPVASTEKDQAAEPLLLPVKKFAENKSHILLEIVGAEGLSSVKDDISSFCVVKLGDKEVHRTKVIENDTSPIWTIKSESICLLEWDSDKDVTIDLCYFDSIVSTAVVGSIDLSWQDVLGGNGSRREFQLKAAVTLAVRSREASREDIMCFEEINSRSILTSSILTGRSAPKRRPMLTKQTGSSRSNNKADDTDFKSVSSKNLLQKQSKTVVVGGVKQTAFRVWPSPDPDNPDETTFMTKQQIYNASTQPSKQWVEGGAGDFGTVHLEILACDDLPNMDVEFVDGKTDAFVACLYEDTYVRSSVIHDSLNPRWVPWATRAFMFQIQHPSSILYLGVFDYDEGPLEQHDPIGRVVIHIDTFEENTVYTLKYPLYEDSEEDGHRGTVTLRLRIQWNNPAEVTKAQTFLPPPRIIINAKEERSWRILRYLTRGSVDMQDVTLESVKLYAEELVADLSKFCFLLDVLAEILLWRGQTTINVDGEDKPLWFPIHSLLLFLALLTAVERPDLLPSIVLYAIAYALLINNYQLSNHPDPWSRVRSYRRILSLTRTLPLEDSSQRVKIEPEVGVAEARQLDLLDKYKQHRVTGFIYEFLMTGLKVYRVYSKNTPVDISTVSKSGGIFTSLYADYLYYGHVLLQMLCKYIRLLRNFFNWKVNTTYKVTTNLLLTATLWCFFPYKYLARWGFRIFVWSCFGPWIKLVDIFFIKKYYRTKEDLIRDGIPETEAEMKEEIANRPFILDPLVKSGWVRQLGHSGRIVIEDNIKLRDFREKEFGKYSERVPAVDTARFPSIPLSTSFAQPYGSAYPDEEDGDYKDNNETDKKWSYVPGQKLFGVMIPRPIVNPTKGQDANSDTN